MRKVVWAPRAVYDYEHNLAYLTEEWGEVAVKNFAKRTLSALQKIVAYPYAWPESEQFRGARKIVINSNVVLYYRVQEHQIELARFFNVRQHPDKVNL